MTGSGQKHVAVTGASGYVGGRLVDRFRRDGWTVTRLARTAGAEVQFDLEGAVDAAVFRSRGIDTLVHCAYDFRPVAWRDIERVNVNGSRRLLSAAGAGGVKRIVLLSSISAFPGCRSLYGRAKLAIEDGARKIGAAIVRSGLVFVDPDEKAGGMYGSLERSARARVVPLIGGGTQCQYLIHIDDLYRLVAGLASGDLATPLSPVVAASPRCWTVRELVQTLSRRQGHDPRFVSVPWHGVWLGLKCAELVGLRLGYRSDSVVSIVYQDPHPDFSTISSLGVDVREFA